MDGTLREGQVRRSQLKAAGSIQRKNSNTGKAFLSTEMKLEEKKLKEEATKHLQKQKHMDPSFWCLEPEGAGDGEGVGEMTAEDGKALPHTGDELTKLLEHSRGTSLGLGKKVVVSITQLEE